MSRPKTSPPCGVKLGPPGLPDLQLKVRPAASLNKDVKLWGSRAQVFKATANAGDPPLRFPHERWTRGFDRPHIYGSSLRPH